LENRITKGENSQEQVNNEVRNLEFHPLIPEGYGLREGFLRIDNLSPRSILNAWSDNGERDCKSVKRSKKL
jgi:hypothetical protein